MVKGSKIFDLVKILLWRYPQDMANKFCSTATLLFDSNNLEVLDVAYRQLTTTTMIVSIPAKPVDQT